MVIYKLIFYDTIITIFKYIRIGITQLMILQRLPVVLIAAILIVFTRCSYALFGRHRAVLMLLRFTFRVGFFLRGIRVSLHLPKGHSLMGLPGIHLCNDFYMSYWLLFAYLPYDHLIVPSDAFFSNEWFRSMLFVFGFYPQEHGMTPDNFKEFDSRMDVYLDQGFSFWQPVFFEYRETDALPYAVVMALKHQLPIHIWKFNDVDGLDFVHWLNRRRIQLTLVEEVAISRRVALTISAYNRAILNHFGKSLVVGLSDFQTTPGMPQSNKDLARKKIAESKKLARELENEALDQ